MSAEAMEFLSALAEYAPQVAYAGSPRQYVAAVIANVTWDAEQLLPDGLNRPLVERIRLLLERANREAELAVKLRHRCEQQALGSSSDI